jgi:hypothetical protein
MTIPSQGRAKLGQAGAEGRAVLSALLK